MDTFSTNLKKKQTTLQAIKLKIILCFEQILLPRFFPYAPTISKFFCLLFPFKLKAHYFPIKIKPCEFEVITIAFNNHLFIKQQIILCKKYFPQHMQLVVADNSVNKIIRKQILALCKDYHIKYIAIPQYRPRIFRLALSHGLALNWLYTNYIKPHQQLRYFGFIDHDVFPLRKITPMRTLLKKQHMYGYPCTYLDYWFLWPGLSFYSCEYLKSKTIDFQVSVHYPTSKKRIVLNTGSANWNKVYTKALRKKLRHTLVHNYFINPLLSAKEQKECRTLIKETQNKRLPINETIEIFGKKEWLHLQCTSYYISKEKIELIKAIAKQKFRKNWGTPIVNTRINFVGDLSLSLFTHLKSRKKTIWSAH